MSDDGKRPNRYEPATAAASMNEAKFNTQSLKLADQVSPLAPCNPMFFDKSQ